MATALPMYQGEDWAQQLAFFADEAQTTPIVFANPVMDVRSSKDDSLLASFDETGTREGTATVSAPGVLDLAMPFTATAELPASSYALDIFVDVNGQRKPILKRGALTLKVTARVTIDDNPVQGAG